MKFTPTLLITSLLFSLTAVAKNKVTNVESDSSAQAKQDLKNLCQEEIKVQSLIYASLLRASKLDNLAQRNSAL